MFFSGTLLLFLWSNGCCQFDAFLNPAWTSGSFWFTYCWSLAWRILSIILLACEMSTIVHSSEFIHLVNYTCNLNLYTLSVIHVVHIFPLLWWYLYNIVFQSKTQMSLCLYSCFLSCSFIFYSFLYEFFQINFYALIM